MLRHSFQSLGGEHSVRSQTSNLFSPDTPVEDVVEVGDGQLAPDPDTVPTIHVVIKL